MVYYDVLLFVIMYSRFIISVFFLFAYPSYSPSDLQPTSNHRLNRLSVSTGLITINRVDRANRVNRVNRGNRVIELGVIGVRLFRGENLGRGMTSHKRKISFFLSALENAMAEFPVISKE